jgi:hypothetical protein
MMDISAPGELLRSQDLQIPQLLTERATSISEQFRYVDNEELTLVSILNEDGQLTLSARLVEFMILMTRLTKVKLKFTMLRSSDNYFFSWIIEYFVYMS